MWTYLGWVNPIGEVDWRLVRFSLTSRTVGEKPALRWKRKASVKLQTRGASI